MTAVVSQEAGWFVAQALEVDVVSQGESPSETVSGLVTPAQQDSKDSSRVRTENPAVNQFVYPALHALVALRSDSQVNQRRFGRIEGGVVAVLDALDVLAHLYKPARPLQSARIACRQSGNVVTKHLPACPRVL